MYKYFFSCLFILLLCGCSTNIDLGGKSSSIDVPKEIISGRMECAVEDSSFVLELENGQIVRYIDSIDGELKEETVNILNEEYLVGVTDNDEAIRRMNEGLSDLGGHCE